MVGKTPDAGGTRSGGRRAARVGSVIQMELSAMIQRGLKDPRLEMVSITGVEVTDDLQAAKVFFCVYDPAGSRGGSRNGPPGGSPARSPGGGRGRAAEAAAGFRSALGFIRRELLHRLDLRKLPEITFHYDPSFDYGERIERLLKEAHAHGGESQDPGKGAGDGEDE